MIKTLNILLASFLCFILVPLLGQSQTKLNIDKDSSLSDSIHQFIKLHADYGKFHGSVLVAKDGQVIYKNGFGFANVETGAKNTTQTKFRLASITKQFTAMLTMQMVSQNKLDLHTSITEYLPEYPDKSKEITIHQLLTHSSGIPSYTDFPDYWSSMSQYISPEKLVKSFADSTLLFNPGEQYRYSNSGYALLGFILEEVSGKSYDRLLQENIFDPIGMVNSGVESYEAVIPNRAIGYQYYFGQYEHANFIDMSKAYSAGAIYSTVEDLLLWDQALYSEKLLPPALLDTIFKKHIKTRWSHYGYGWEIGEISIGNTEEQLEMIEHSGGINGFNTKIIRVPDRQYTIILLNNTGSSPLWQISSGLLGILESKPYNLPKKSLAEEILKVLKEGDDSSSATALFNEKKSDEKYELKENDMNLAGYEFMKEDDPQKAAEIFKLNMSAFPKSANTYDSYAEALMELGHIKESIAYYKKSLYYNPKNENGISMLKKLGVDLDTKKLYLIQSDPDWQKEIFIFPLRFASTLPFNGREEAHFPPNWRKMDSDEFWSYSLAWNININEPLSIQDLNKYIQEYFDGLMQAVNRDPSKELPKTISRIDEESKLSKQFIEGTIEIYDAFVTEKNLQLYTRIRQDVCDQGKSTVYLSFSPKEFKSSIWGRLDRMLPKEVICEIE